MDERSGPAHPEVVLRERDGVVTARIDRADAGNACSSGVMAGLEAWLDLGEDPDVRALVLTGTGTSFCAGADLREATALLAEPVRLRDFLARGLALVQRIRRAPVPTLAAVNGVAFGGGLELVMACDVAVAGVGARLGDRHLAVGQVPGWGSSVLLPEAVGPVFARRLLLTGEDWSADEAARHGLVSEVVADHDLADHVHTLALRIAAHDPTAARRMLTLVRGSSDWATDGATDAAPDAWDREWSTLLDHLDHQARRAAPAIPQEAP